VAGWTERIQAWLDTGPDPWYAGRPLLVNENDYELRLYNGDTGVVVAEDDRLVAAFDRGLRFSPTRLSAVDTAYAMTIHKSQGSQFGTAAVLLPEPEARILTRELLYTAVTRARRRLILAGSEAAIRAAVKRPIARASGLRDRLARVL
jgi:exodeoxyribonuclease V alpha subunit